MRRFAVLLSLLAACSAAGAQGFPSKPIRVIIPFVAGGSSDIVGRAIASKFQEQLGQPGVVENKPGANGAIAAEFVAKADPDGYTILVGSIGVFSINAALFKDLRYNPVRDFAPVTLAVTTPNVLITKPGLAASSPVLDGAPGPALDNRLVAYRENARRVPSVTGRVVPERVHRRAEYRRDVLGRMYEDMAELDPEGTLRHEWLNARGAIARLERGEEWPMMSSVWVPTTSAPSSSESVFHLSITAVSAGSAVPRVTRWFCEAVRSRTTSPLRVLMTRLVSVTTRP